MKYLIFNVGSAHMCIREVIPARFYKGGGNIKGISHYEREDLKYQMYITKKLSTNPHTRKLCLRLNNTFFERCFYTLHRLKLDSIYKIYSYNVRANKIFDLKYSNVGGLLPKITSYNIFIFDKFEDARMLLCIILYLYYVIPNFFDIIYGLK